MGNHVAAGIHLDAAGEPRLLVDHPETRRSAHCSMDIIKRGYDRMEDLSL